MEKATGFDKLSQVGKDKRKNLNAVISRFSTRTQLKKRRNRQKVGFFLDLLFKRTKSRLYFQSSGV